ncbi:MAG TPA: hypothetical protein VFA00_10685 [Actinomycetota bacterium]|nr:hypothetical protein [Actinomycetota bacterium]
MTERVSEVEAAVEKASPAIAEPGPDGATFVVLELENEEELDLLRRKVPTR